MPKRAENTVRHRPPIRRLTFDYRTAERIAPASGFDSEIRKNGAQRPLTWEDEKP